MKKALPCYLFGHLFGPWEFVSADFCIQSRICKRDGFTESRSVPHEFTEWKYISDDSCKMIRQCSRCPEQQIEIHHCWEDWIPFNDQEHIRYCNRDNQTETEKHNFIHNEIDKCPVCDGKGGEETSGGYSNIEQKGFNKCPNCEGTGWLRIQCSECGYTEYHGDRS